jgi:hypothetical protein
MAVISPEEPPPMTIKSYAFVDGVGSGEGWMLMVMGVWVVEEAIVWGWVGNEKDTGIPMELNWRERGWKALS